MPAYEYLCTSCKSRVRLFYSYAEYDNATPVCPHCGSSALKRRLSRIAIPRSEESRIDSLMSDDSLAGLEDDPRAMGQFMRQMSREMGEDLGEEYDEMASRLEKASPRNPSSNPCPIWEKPPGLLMTSRSKFLVVRCSTGNGQPVQHDIPNLCSDFAGRTIRVDRDPTARVGSRQ